MLSGFDMPDPKGEISFWSNNAIIDLDWCETAHRLSFIQLLKQLRAMNIKAVHWVPPNKILMLNNSLNFNFA
jgi:isocitrate lyase